MLAIAKWWLHLVLLPVMESMHAETAQLSEEM